MRRQPFSRHAGFFASLQRVEDRLASESEQKESPPPPTTATATARQTEASPFSDTMTASPLLFLDPAAPAPAPGSSSGPALDFLTAATQEGQSIQQEDDDHDGGGEGDGEEDIARLMALLGLSPPPPGGGSRDDDGGGCGCSGADGFLAKVVGVVGPKCDREKGRLDAWIRHYHRGGCREPARLAHLLLARAAADTAAVAFPASVKDFLDHDPPRQLTDESEWSDANGDNNRD